MDAMLPFGLNSALKVSNVVADALERSATKAGMQVLYYYLDDFIVHSPSVSEEGA